MFHSTMDVYQIKRKAVHFAKGIASKCNQVETKFTSHFVYGILKSRSVILKDIADALHEPIQVKNTKSSAVPIYFISLYQKNGESIRQETRHHG